MLKNICEISKRKKLNEKTSAHSMQNSMSAGKYSTDQKKLNRERRTRSVAVPHGTHSEE